VTGLGTDALARLPRRALLAATVGVLVLALLAVSWVQVHQYRLLNETTKYQDDYLQVSVHQLQAEYLRLRLEIHHAREEGLRERNRLQLRYDVFVSRADLLTGPSAQRLMGHHPAIQDTVARTQAFVARADRLLGPKPSEELTADALRTLDAELAALDAAIHELTLEASHIVSAQAALRETAVNNYNRVAIALTALLSLSTFGFALLAIGQLRRLDERRRALEQLTSELRLAQRDAEAASRAKSAFLANMSHEIRTPFQGLLGMLQVLDADTLAPQQRAHLHTARDSARHLLAILNDILDMAKLEAGTLSVSPEAVALRDLVGDVQQLMQPLAAAKLLALDIDVDAQLPERARLDGTRVRQVLYNLISNAIKFTDSGRVTLEVRPVGSEWLAFAVTDTGAGIDTDMLPRLFQRFGQGDDSPSRRHGGTGLGLEISRNLARLMGGDLTVQSAPGRGSRFEMRLPLQRTDPPPAGVTDTPATAVGPAGPALRALHLLAAEDNAVNREVLAAMIDLAGHRVTFAEDGAAAVRAAQAQPFDLVLMDLHMPELDGIGATRAIRAMAGPMARVPIVALTADVFPETRARCLEAGMNDFLTKPIGLPELMQLLARHVDASVATVAA
jgi:signal transduction histidine kinase/ActR/RegA family two-component response regulator